MDHFADFLTFPGTPDVIGVYFLRVLEKQIEHSKQSKVDANLVLMTIFLDVSFVFFALQISCFFSIPGSIL